MSESELLAENICEVFEKDDREAVLGVCEVERKETNRANLLVAGGCVKDEALFSGGDGVLE